MFNFLGPNASEGFLVYYDGSERLTSAGKVLKTFEAGSGEIVIGRYGKIYSTLMMDELLFFNRKLTLEEIHVLSNMDE